MAEWKDLEKLTTLELIDLIKMRKQQSNQEKAEAAFYVFTFRFSEEVSKKCEIICKNWGENADFALEVVEQTFKRFWKYPKFEYAKAKTKDPDKAVLFYLFSISKNVLADLWNSKNGAKINPYDGSEEIIWDYPKIDADCGDIDDMNSHFLIVKRALSTLSEKHKVIFLTYSKHGEDGFKLPRKLLEELREKLGINQQTIRSYHNEAKNKIKEYLDIYEHK